eukprot:TRINITY_DN1715_c0_g1_i2.p1 TRINITY_DN1715_c0_g1~~TRINITY_DN1715_c0_g1_i2.p1  ORF type:complete len:317 (-),score=105.67 TRINITY_DN1715_c0_g1_i2:189-1139(-)
MLSCSPSGPAAAGLREDDSGVPPPFSSWAQRLTKKVLRSHPPDLLLFQRFLGMRSSFKSKKPLGHSSKDSGLGEEDSTEEEVVPPPPQQPPSKKVKHVSIREPSLSTLPSAQRRHSRPTVVRTRVLGGPSELCKSSKDTVQTQWELLQSRTLADLQRAIPELRSHSLGIIFEDSPSPQSLEVEDISSLLRGIYSILYHDWGSSQQPSQEPLLSLSLHLIHNFLISLSTSLTSIQEERQAEYRKGFLELRSNCELIGYSNVEPVLRATQKSFVEFWVSLLQLPLLKDSLSVSEKRALLKLSTSKDPKAQLKHRSSIF